MCPYTPNIPAATDQLSFSQGQIQANFNALAPCVGGIFARQLAAPAIAANDLLVVNLVDTGGNSQLFLQRGAGLLKDITRFVLPAGSPSQGFTMLSSGLCLKYGAASSAPNNNFGDAIYDPTYPFTATPYAVVSLELGANPAAIGLSIGLSPAPLTTLRVYKNPSTLAAGITFTYFAIGPV